MFAFGQTFHCLLCDGVGAGSVAAYMPKTYSDWLGLQVVLQIEAGESLIPLRGLVVNESNNALRFRLDGGWEVDIFKEMTLCA
jgi:RNase P/RNase MRP subunit p29